MILDLNTIIGWRERNNPNTRKHFELIDGTKRIQMKKETTPNSPVCIWSFTSLIAFIALILLMNLRLLMILRILLLLMLLRLLMFAAFRINMWTRAKERRFLTHRLCSRIVDDEHDNEQSISCHPFAKKQLRGANCQDFVFIRPPGISHWAFALRMDNIWFCKVLLLFQIDSNTDLGWKRHSCAFVSVLEEYTGALRPGNSFRLLTVLTVLMYIAVI